MLFALPTSDSKIRIRPEYSGQRAFCPVCGSEVVARCGRVNAWHWAHLSKTECDSWHEPETEWHRRWKAEFPEANQEIVHFDSTAGEKHVADVKFDSGLVLEFQHSPISPEEVASRCNFYKNILWVVDSGRESDFKKLLNALIGEEILFTLQTSASRDLNWDFADIAQRLLVQNAEIYRIDAPWNAFRNGWTLKFPVAFDFASEKESELTAIPQAPSQQYSCYAASGGQRTVKEQTKFGLTKRVWCLFPHTVTGRDLFYAVAMHRKDFVDTLREHGRILRDRTTQEQQKVSEMVALKAELMKQYEAARRKQIRVGYNIDPKPRRKLRS